VPAPQRRVRAIDWLRGLAMVLMTIDHAGSKLDAHHLHGDTARGWIVGSALPAGEFLTRWITHLCAPVFVLLAGAALALSLETRRDQPGQTAFIVKRGLLIAALDPLWMSLGFAAYHIFLLQVLYAIGVSMVAMAFLRRLPTKVLLAGAILIQVGGEWVGARLPNPYPDGLHFDTSVWQTPITYVASALLLNGGPVHPRLHLICAYPLLPWLAIMMAGWVLGRWLIVTRGRPRQTRALQLIAVGVALLVVFAVVRGIDGYGNWGLHRDSWALLQWLHVAKYPPSLSYTTLELGLGLGLLGLLLTADDSRPRRWLAPLGVFGATALFYYLLHVHLLAIAQALLPLDRNAHGLGKTYLAAIAVLLALYPLCARYQKYKSRRPNGWTRYI
jgi:uncharacterized membrane protein